MLVSQPYPILYNTKGCSPLRFLCPWDFPGKNTGVGSHSLLQEIFLMRNQTWIFYVAGRFFTICATREAQESSLFEKYKPKLQWGITSHQSEWPSSRIYKQMLETKRRMRASENEMTGCYHQCNGHEFRHTGRWWGAGRPGVLQSVESQSQTWLGNWTTIIPLQCMVHNSLSTRVNFLSSSFLPFQAHTTLLHLLP